MKMKVILCDDEKSTCEGLEKILQSYALQNDVKLETVTFFTGDALIEYLDENKSADLLFLDIELPGQDGIKVGDYIRKELENEQIFLVYISSKEQYAMQLFKNRPFDFLIKPLKEKEIFELLDRIYRLMGKGNQNFEYQEKGVYYRLPYRDIFYFQSAGRRINIVTAKGIKGFYGKLTEVEKALPAGLFLNIHKSYLVNVHYVEEYTYEWVKMVNGDILSISKIHRATVRKKILEREMDELENS
jgi:DNA-binding LytR/AlgR family response regulator